MKKSNPLPTFLYGTAWKEENTQRCVEAALEAGFRGFDTANQRKHYYEAGLGAGLGAWIAAGRVKRADLFLQTKFTYIGGQDHRLPYDPHAMLHEQVRQSFASSLEHLQTNYLDSYVLHGPSNGRVFADQDWDVWRAMEKIKGQGKVSLLGVSNINTVQLRKLCEEAKVKPAFVQNRCYAHLGRDREIRAICRAEGILYQGFSLLTANKETLRHPDFRGIAARLDCTPAQAIFAFARQAGMLPLTGTTDPAHIAENLESLNLTLTPSDLEAIENLWI